jgi:TetR/AcrR family transcriptional repressor of bet genes
MARPSNTETRRSEILGGLRKVMARRGYVGASVAEIARAAGVTAGLVHYHFDDKREILLAFVDALAQEAGDRAERALARGGEDALGRLEAYIDAFLSRETDPDPEAVACWVAIAAEAIRDPRVKKAFSAALAGTAGFLERLVADALTEARHPTRDARAVAATLLATMQGYFLVSATAPDLIPRGSAADMTRRLARLLVQGVGS